MATLMETYCSHIEPVFFKALEENNNTDVIVKVFSSDGVKVLENYASTKLNSYCGLEAKSVLVKWLPSDEEVVATVILEDNAEGVFRFIEGRNRA